MNPLRRYTRFSVPAVMLTVCGVSLQADVPWRHDTVSITADAQPAGDLLRSFAAAQGLTLDLSAAATAPVSGEFDGLAPRQFLDAICDANDLAWFWDGARLHVHAADEMQTRTLDLPAVTAGEAAAAFSALGFESGPAARASGVRGTGDVISLTGGTQFLAIAEPVLRTLDAQAAARQAAAAAQAARDEAAARAENNALHVRVFRLKYASAGDLVVNGGTSQTIVPGVARALQNIMGTTSAALSTGVGSTPRARVHAGLRGSGLAAIGREPEVSAPSAAPVTDVLLHVPETLDPNEAGTGALIQADPRLNAVIVRDVASRMPLYESLIEDLDVASPVIEIAAAVVDIDTSNGKALGVEFLSFGDGNSSTIGRIGFEADRSFNQGDGDNSATNPVFNDGTDLVRGPGLLSSVLVPVDGYELLVRVRALEEKGAAQLVTSPSVITLENVEAVLRQEETVYVRVAGQESTDLFDVRAGVQLRVTPTLVQEGDQLMFKLVVNVQDGSFSDLLIDGVPTTRESAINTQALVPTDRTLLIGGYFVERQVDNARQVPLLGDVPVLGRLFKRTESNRSRAQRYFFITPRLVDVHREARLNQAAAKPDRALPVELASPDLALERAHQLAGNTRPPVTAATPTDLPNHDG